MTMSYRPLLSATDLLLALCRVALILSARRSEPPVGHVLRELDQRPGCGTRSALGGIPMRGAFVERRARDIQMRPADAVRDELLQEQASDQHPAATAVRGQVSQVGHGRLQALAEFGGQRHRPHRLAGAAGGIHHRLPRDSSFDITPPTRGPSATICAPVSVATSIRMSGESAALAASTSASTSRPSASVLVTSTVVPPNMVS